MVITISRQFGSGGHEVAAELSRLLGIPVYDKELIMLAAEKSGMSSDALSRADEIAASSLLYSLAVSASYRTIGNVEMPINDKLFAVQSDIIRDLAERQDCIIIGRCADYILREYPGRISVYIYGPLSERSKRQAEALNISEKDAQSFVTKSDKKRANYYNYYTGRNWNDPENYHMLLDSSYLGAEGCARLIAGLYLQRKNSK